MYIIHISVETKNIINVELLSGQICYDTQQ